MTSHWTMYDGIVSICNQKRRVNLRYWRYLNSFIVKSKLTTLQTAILFQLHYDGNDLNQMNAEDENDFMHRLATEAKTQIRVNGTQLLFLRSSTLDTCRFTRTLWYYYISTVSVLHAVSNKTIFAVLDVWFRF